MKKVVIGIISFIISFIVIFGYLISKELKMEDNLKREIQEINILLKQDVLNDEKINKLLDRTITKGKYRLVELSVKLYAKDYINKYKQIIEITNSNEMKILLTADNLEKNKTDLNNLKSYVSDSIQNLELYKKEYLLFYQEEKIMSYLDNNSDDYYKEFYRDELIGNIENAVEAENSINKFINKLKMANKVLDLLNNHLDEWQVEDNQIYLDETILNEYNSYIKEIIDDTNNNFTDSI